MDPYHRRARGLAANLASRTTFVRFARWLGVLLAGNRRCADRALQCLARPADVRLRTGRDPPGRSAAASSFTTTSRISWPAETRSLDGGLFLFGIDPQTGQVLYQRHLYGPYGQDGQPVISPETAVGATGAGGIQGNKGDILLAEDGHLFLRHEAFTPDLKSVQPRRTYPAAPDYVPRVHRTGPASPQLVDD